MTPEVFGEYLLTGRLAERSMAEVFLAVKLGDRSGRAFVLKRPPLGERASGVVAESLRREADVLRASSIDGVVGLSDEGEVGGLPFVVVEHVRGVPLSTLLRQGAFETSEAALVARDLAKVIGRLHERGWVHGDITPSNVIVDDAGELMLIDLGLARRIGEARETPAGKAGYASPEAAVGKDATQSDDIYGWGVVVAECLLGAPLFVESDLAEAAARRGVLPAVIGEIAKLKEALGLEARRRPSADEIVAAIEAPPSSARTALGARVGGFEVEPASLRPSRRSSLERGPQSQRAALVVAAARPADPIVDAQRPAIHSGPSPIRRRLLLAVAVVIAVGVGFFTGRRSERRTIKTSLTLPMLPARAEIELDGKRMIVPEAGRAIPIEPGRHSLSVSSIGKGEREYEFVAEPGDHVVIVTVRMPSAKAPSTKRR